MSVLTFFFHNKSWKDIYPSVRTVSASVSCVCVQSCPVFWDPEDCKSAKLLCPWNSLSKNTGAGCHFQLQRIFPTQGLNPRLLCWLFVWVQNGCNCVGCLPSWTCSWLVVEAHWLCAALERVSFLLYMASLGKDQSLGKIKIQNAKYGFYWVCTALALL